MISAKLETRLLLLAALLAFALTFVTAWRAG